MQVTEAAAHEWAAAQYRADLPRAELWLPATNIEAGVKHLKSLLQRLPVALALAAYNAGEAAVQRFNGIPPYAETRNYVSRILTIANR